MGSESQAKRARRGDPTRRLAKRIERIERIVNYRIGRKLVEAYKGEVFSPDLLARARGFVLRALRELNVDMAGLDVTVETKGNLLALKVVESGTATAGLNPEGGRK
jgi:hypothetical protein